MEKERILKLDLPDGRIRCLVCPCECVLGKGMRGRCGNIEEKDGKLWLITYGKAVTIAMDPIEKKPLYHFFPGSEILSIGNFGCNLQCQFCQNWHISTAGPGDLPQKLVSPERLVELAIQYGAPSIAFTYNEPGIALEYFVDTAQLAHEKGIKMVAVTNGYLTEKGREYFFKYANAANIDLKSIRSTFYRDFCHGKLEPVLETIRYVYHHTSCWLEITNLVIPGLNDSDDDLRDLCTWVYDQLGSYAVLHFSAFHPDYRMRDRGPTPFSTLKKAWEIAQKVGLSYVYLGNVSDPKTSATYCHQCKGVLIERRGFFIERNLLLERNRCPFCNVLIPGQF